jgi:hypothetical protein
MSIPEELVSLINKQSGDMEKKMIEAYIRDSSVEAIVEIAKQALKEGDYCED